jgi:hypothetical protein
VRKPPNPGVFYRSATRKCKSGEERIYYIVFKQGGKVIEEKVGRQFADKMTLAKASGIRAERIEGKRDSRKQQREAALIPKEEETSRYIIGKLWDQYQLVAFERKSKADEGVNALGEMQESVTSTPHVAFIRGRQFA